MEGLRLASTAAPKGFPPSSTPQRWGATMWARTWGATTPALHSSSWCEAHTAVIFSPPCSGLATPDTRQKLLIWQYS